MKNIITIMKKELKRFFTDYRMLASLILPGLLIFVMYTLMGTFMDDMMKVEADYKYSVYVVNQPESVKVLDTSEDYDIQITVLNTAEKSIDSVKADIENKDIDLLIVYDEDFDTKVMGGQKPNVEIFYNSISSTSSEIFSYYYQGLGLSSAIVTPIYYVLESDMASTEDISSMLVTMLMPMLLAMLLFSGCMAITTESIAGEKERGTMATMLVTPVRRSDIAIGKILALSITALVSAVSSFLGTIMSLPNLMSNNVQIDLSMYGVTDYICLFFIIVTTVLLFTVMLSIVSCYAKSIKEANSYATPIMILVMMAGMGSSFSGSGAVSNNLLYLIPVFNSVQCMTGIFSMSFNLTHMIITIVSNIVYVGLGVLVINKMFDSESIMFNK